MRHAAGFLAAAAILAALPAGAQQNEVKGWVARPKPGQEQPGQEQPAQGVAQPPRTISRGQGEGGTPVAQPDTPVAQPGPGPVGPGGPVADGDWLLATDPEAIRDVMLAAGYAAELTTDDNGAPLIVSQASNSNFWVMFLDCNTPRGCLAVEFYVGYEFSQKPSPDQLNDFNSNFRYVRTYVTGNVVSMAMDVLMQNGGVDVPTYLEYLRLWSSILTDWERSMNLV